MKNFFMFFLSFLLIFCLALTANAGLLGNYYNLDSDHPDMQPPVWNGGTGMVESNLSGSTPTETASSNYNQFDWWNPSYYAFNRVDSDADLNTAFSSSWFPVTGYSGTNEPHYFAVHWTGQFYVDTDKDYTYTMGSDDDSWLFIDNQLVLDLGGVHAMSWANYTLPLTQGFHDIDIFFAERHTVQSGFQLNFFSDLEPPPTTDPIPEPATMLLFGFGLIGLAGATRRKLKK